MPMANRIIPKERLSSYKNWEMDAFEQTGPSASRFGESRQPGSTGRKGARGTEHLHEQVEQVHQQAKHDGYAVGHNAGYKAGCEAGQEAGHNEGYKAGYQAGYAA